MLIVLIFILFVGTSFSSWVPFEEEERNLVRSGKRRIRKKKPDQRVPDLSSKADFPDLGSSASNVQRVRPSKTEVSMDKVAGLSRVQADAVPVNLPDFGSRSSANNVESVQQPKPKVSMDKIAGLSRVQADAVPHVTRDDELNLSELLEKRKIRRNSENWSDNPHIGSPGGYRITTDDFEEVKSMANSVLKVGSQIGSGPKKKVSFPTEDSLLRSVREFTKPEQEQEMEQVSCFSLALPLPLSLS